MSPERGEVYWLELGASYGCEQSGRRPVLIVSDDAINRLPLVVVVVPGTDARNVARDYPVNVRVRSAECTGLPRDTVFMCFQMRAIDPRHLGARLARLPAARMVEVDEALRRALGI
ncbi:MAG: type II toxin-antitoxin system PemK/MazF family toxin [Candidatus Eremiobacterota bacterium]